VTDVPIPLARPRLGDAERAAADRVLGSGRLTLGPETERFEIALAAATGRRGAVAVSSGTSALELAFWALELAPGDEVLMSGFGFPAAANAVRRAGGRPVPVDVEARTWNLDAGALAAALGPRVRAVVSIDQLGLVAEADPLVDACAAAGVPLIDDAACGLGGHDAAGVPGGGYGICGTLSFHPRKLITTGEGGAVVSDDDALLARIRELRHHGQAGPGRFARIGTNARLTEVGAAIGAAQLARIDALVAERRLLADGHRRRLANLVASERISLQEAPAGATHVYQTFAVLLAPRLDRARALAALAARGIESGPATYAFHRLPTHADAARGPLPVSDALHDRALALPLWPGMRSAELDRVADGLAAALEAA
jgi:dTDP-4-amino-4,6-dideoxygalactose transaminase